MSFINKTVSGAGAALPSAGSGSANASASMADELHGLRADVNDLIGEFKDATDDKMPEFKRRLRGLAGSVESEGNRLLNRALDSTRVIGSKANAQIVQARDTAETYITDHPWRSVGAIAALTAAATVAVSLLCSRSGAPKE